MTLPRISIPPSEDLEGLRRSVETAINRTIELLNNTKTTEDLSMNSHRITNLKKGISLNDAVTVGQLSDAIRKRGRDIIRNILASDGGSSGGGSLVVTVYKLTLTGSTNITHATPTADGELLMVVLTQDATGGRVITWEATDFAGDPPVEIDGTASFSSIFLFTGVDSKWVLLSYQTGLSL